MADTVVHRALPGVCRILAMDDPESEISKYAKEKTPVRVEGTHIWYVAPADMPKGLLPMTYWRRQGKAAK